MTSPTKKVIAAHCAKAGATEKQANTWATFLHGLDWSIIKPLVQIAQGTGAHPALVAGTAARTTGDDTVRATLTAHLEAKSTA